MLCTWNSPEKNNGVRLPFPSPGDLPNTDIKPRTPVLLADFYSLNHQGRPYTQSVQLLSHVWPSTTPWTAAHQASLSITNCQSLPKPISIESVMPSNHLIPCCPHLLLHSIIPSMRVFSNESALHIRWSKFWIFSFNISLSNEHPGLISFRMDWLDLLVSKRLSRVFSKTTVQKHQFFGAQPSSQSNSHIHIWPLEKP